MRPAASAHTHPGRSFQDPAATAGFQAVMRSAIEHKREAQLQVPWAQLRAQAHRLKAEAIGDLDRLLVHFEREFSARGGTVLWAPSARDAVEHVLAICRRHGVSTLVKGKSMISEEIDLNDALQASGIEAVETDLGEFIIALACDQPSHITAPALHLSRGDIGELFARKLGIPYSDDPHVLMTAARDRLRETLLRAQAGLTGVNFAVADTGTIVVVENEGNGGLSATLPPVHISLMGIEKIIARLADLPVFLQLLARAATGQKLTSYTHHFLGPEEGRKAYCVVIDAGRSEVLADPKTRESLYCIRCGACLNVCPVYRRAGGAAYRSVYAGPIGSVITAQLSGHRHGAELPFVSTLCGACQEECPVNIDLPHQLVHMRSRLAPDARDGRKGKAIGAAAFLMQGRMTYALASALVRVALRLAPACRPLLPFLSGWTRERALPALPKQSFKAWWKSRERERPR